MDRLLSIQTIREARWTKTDADRRREAQAAAAVQEARDHTAAVRERCSTLAGFIAEAWHILEPDAPYVHNWHIDAICDHLEAVTRGEINRLLINVPPGSMKSLIVSVFWNAWEWGPKGRRSLRYLTTAHNDEPVKRDTVKCRSLILSPWYQALWPEVDLNKRGEFAIGNTGTGTRTGVAFGSLTSQRGDRLIIDDPHSTKTAESEAERAETVRQFREGATNRLNDQERSAIVIIMQRLHAEDVSGVILKLGLEYVHLMLPMEFEPDRACVTYVGGKEFFRDPRTYDGELLDPERFPALTLAKLYRAMGSYAKAGQYQQRPAPRRGGMFDRTWFEFVPAKPAGGRTVRGWDLAASAAKLKTASPTGGPAYTAGVKLAVVDEVFYILDARRTQQAPAGVEAFIKATASQDGPYTRISIPQDPGQAAKGQVAAFTKLLVGYDVRFSPETGSKEIRATPVSAQAEGGNIKIVRTGIPARDAWIEPFLDELSLFPTGEYKDQADALSRAFAELLEWNAVRAASIGMPVQSGQGEDFA